MNIMPKVDYKKDFKDLYLPKATPALVDVPPMTFIMVDGAGDPNGEEYQQAVSALYSLSYTVKMKGKELAGYYEYTVFPLEGLWWIDGGAFDFDRRDNWLWTAMIRQPDFVQPDVFEWAVKLAQKKKPELCLSKARLEAFAEGLCVQAMHIGPYADEPATIGRMHSFMEDNHLADATGNVRKHHEIYLSDPNKAKPEKMNTVLRLPVEKK